MTITFDIERDGAGELVDRLIAPEQIYGNLVEQLCQAIQNEDERRWEQQQERRLR